MLPDFRASPLWLDGLVFLTAGVAVWIAGTRLSRNADAIARRTGIGQAVLGVFLLGGVTSLPEVAVAVTASLDGNAALAVNNVLGGLAMQVAILAAADAVIGRDALTSVVAEPALLLQATLLVLLLVLAIAGITLGDVGMLGMGGFAWGILGVYAVALWLVAQARGQRAWRAQPNAATSRRGKKTGAARRATDGGSAHAAPLTTTLIKTIACAAVILPAGVVLAKTGEAIATKTELGSSFVGAVLVAGATSLPEVSTVLAAVRLRRYDMAVSDIFGTNLTDIALVPLVDALSPGAPVLGQLGPVSILAALLSISLTMVYVAGLIERRDRTVLRMGIDSLVVLLIYAGGLVLLYRLR